MVDRKVALVFLNVFALSTAFPNIFDTLTSNPNTTQLVSLINQAGLADTLKGSGPFTVFAPTDAAFAKVSQADLQALTGDNDALKDTLLYHVVNGEIFTWDLRTGERITTVNNHTIRVYVQNGKHYFNQALAVVEEIQASNGVIYLIDEVLNVPEGTIMDILNNPDYNLTMFAKIVKQNHLDIQYTLNSASSTTRYTVFAPTDDAFSSLPATLLSQLSHATTYGRYLGQYHIHQGTLHASGLEKDGTLSTVHTGHDIKVTHDAGTMEPLLNTLAHIAIQDIEAENGVVHVITHVLIPSTLAQIIG